ncbi:MAG: sigma-70 family RNA polymerase sigma factor [Saprospiraceae bacterium]|nr:sigma-70 family RNA polymerase sigma factor [Saprospiraceae bacterium]
MVEQKQVAFMEAYEPCHEAFIRYCSAVAYGKMEIEDLVQDVLLSAYEHFDKIAKKDQFLHYLIRAARNKSITQWRRSKYKTELLEQHKNELQAQGTPPEVALDIELLYRALDQLPEKQRDAIILFEISGFSMIEIAQIQNSKENAVKTRISRGRKRLRALMKEEETSHSSAGVLGTIPIFWAMEQMHPDEQLFEYLRRLPTDLSKEKVLGIIQKLPTLPPLKSNWLQNIHQINLNTIIMSSTSIAILIGALVFFTPKEITRTIASLPEEGTEENTSEIIPEEKTLPETALLTAIDGAVYNVKTEITRASVNKNVTSSASKISVQDIPQKLVMLPQSLAAKPLFIKNIIPNQKINTSSAFDDNDCAIPVHFEGDIKQFKRKLTKYLENDDLISSNIRKVRLSFAEDEVVVNQSLIPAQLQQKYIQYLYKHNIYACPTRIVEMTTDYIAVGDVTKDGFKGRTHGSLDLNVLNKINTKELQAKGKQVEERPIGAFQALKVSGLAVVHLSKGATKSARVEVSGMPIEDLVTEEKDGVLTITTRGQYSGETINVFISTPSLKSIEVGGAGELYSKETIKADKLEISVVDVGAAWLNVEVSDVTINLKGGDLTISGTADRQHVRSIGRDASRGTLDNQQLKLKEE